MSSSSGGFSLGSHDIEHQRLLRQGQYQPQPVAALPGAGNFDGQRLTLNSIDYYWNATLLKWLSTQIFTAVYGARSAGGGDLYAQAAQTFDIALWGYNRGNGVYLVDSLREVFFNAAQSVASHYDTTATVQAGGTPTIAAGTFMPSTAIASGSWKPMLDTLGIVVPATSQLLQVTMTPAGATGTPGTFFMVGTIGYQLIG
jgi:hypothetical protein